MSTIFVDEYLCNDYGFILIVHLHMEVLLRMSKNLNSIKTTEGRLNRLQKGGFDKLNFLTDKNSD